jgi:hypothetical protein
MYSGVFENRHGGLRTTNPALAGNGKLRTIQPNPILPGSPKEATE